MNQVSDTRSRKASQYFKIRAGSDGNRQRKLVGKKSRRWVEAATALHITSRGDVAPRLLGILLVGS